MSSTAQLTSHTQLQATWQNLANIVTYGVQGVLEINSGIPGPTVGITVLTHGNEPAGLAAVWYFLTQNPLQNLLLKGKVIFVINNLEASTAYWNATSEEATRATRFIDVNMNRLPSKKLGTNTSEERRATELLPIWQSFDYALDIHSTTQPTRPMVILGNGPQAANLCKQFDIETVLANILNVQLGYPAIGFYGHPLTSTLGVEVGGHHQPQSLNRAIQTAAEFLHATGIIPSLTQELGYTPEFTQQQLYTVYDKLLLPHPEACLTRVFADFETVQAGEVLATEPDQQHTVKQQSLTLFGPTQTQVQYPNEEALFLLTPAIPNR